MSQTGNKKNRQRWTRSRECEGVACSCREVWKPCRGPCGLHKPLCYFSKRGGQLGTNGNPRRKSSCIDCLMQKNRDRRAARLASCLEPRAGEVAGYVFEDGQDAPVGEIIHGADGVPAVRPFVRLSRKQKGG